MTISFQPATITNCNYIGQTKYGICAVVLVDGVEVFRSEPSSKRIMPRLAAEAFIAAQVAA